MTPTEPPSRSLLTGIGFITGVLGGLLGVGGGFVLVPLQVLVARMDQHRAQATSLAAIIPGSVVAVLIYNFGAGRSQIDWRFALLLVAGSAVGAYAGARVMNRLPEQGLRVVFAVILLALGIKEVALP